jgi:gliding motility-associated-like protein
MRKINYNVLKIKVFFVFLFAFNLTFSQIGTCSSPTAPVNNYPDGATANGASNSNRYTPSPNINTTFTSYHTITSSSTGTLGVIQEINQQNIDPCATDTRASRTAVLYAVGTNCATPISPDKTLANSSYSSTFNPEWYNLQPITQYVLAITTTIGNCTYNDAGVATYPAVAPPSCTTCASATCKVTSITAPTLSEARIDITTALASAGDQYGGLLLIPDETATICVPVKVPQGSTTLGFKMKTTIAPGGCGDPAEQIVTYELKPVNCGTKINPSRTNAQPVGSGFNPEWDNIAAGDYVLCFTMTTDPDMFCSTVQIDGLGYYNVAPSSPPCPTDKSYITLDWNQSNPFVAWASGQTFTCTSPSQTIYKNVELATVTTGGQIQPYPGFKMSLTTNTNSPTKTSALVSVNGVPYSYYGPTGTAPANVLDWGPMGSTSQDIMEPFIPKGATVTVQICDTRGTNQTFQDTIFDYATGAILHKGTVTVKSGSCQTLTVTLSTPTVNWTLDGGSTGITNNNNGSVTFDPSKLSAGTHTLQYSFDNGSGCTLTADPVTFTVTGGPTITPSLTDVCFGATSTNLTYTSTGTPTKYSIDWNTAANSAGLTDVTDVALGVSPISLSIPGTLPAGTYTGSLTAKNASGCSSAAQTITFKVNPAPVITGTASICVGSTAADWTPKTGVTWSSSDATVATVANGATLSGLKAGSATITAKDGNNCQATKTVTINALPTITGTLNLCESSTTQLTGSGTANATSPWTSSATSIATVSNTGLVSGLAGNGGSSDITYKDNNGCTQNATVTVNPSVAPTVTCGASTATSVTFNWNAVTGATGYDLVYNNNNAGNQTVSNQAAISYQITGMAGGTSATIIVTPKGTGCFKASTIQTCTADNCPTPNIDVNPTDLSKCSGQAATFSVTASTNPGVTLAYQWEMSSNNGTSYTSVVDGGVYSGALTNTLSVSNVTGLDTYKYRCVVTEQTSGIGCKKTSTAATLTVNAIPVIDPISNVTLCHGASSSAINFSSTPTGSNFTWLNNTVSIGLGANGSGNITSFTASNTGGAAVVSTVTVSASRNGCAAADKTFTITVNPSIQPTIVCGSPTQTSVTFDWSPGQTGATSYNLSYSINGTGSYTATSNTSTYTVNSLTQGDQVDVTILPVGTGCFVSGTGSCTAINCNQPTFATSPSDISVCEGDGATLSGSSNDAQSIQWQVKNPLTGVWTDISGETNPTISYPLTVLLMDGSQYRLKAIEASGNCPNYTAPVTLTVKPIPTMNALSDKDFCPGTLVNDPTNAIDFDFKISESGSPTYTWSSDDQSTGVSTGGTDVASFASFTTASPSVDAISIINVTPKLNGCAGLPETFKITVKPTVKPIFSASTPAFNSVKFAWNSSSVNPDFWNIDTSIVGTPNAATSGVYKAVSPKVAGAIKEYTVNNVSSSKTVFLKVTPSQDPTNTALFCPMSDFMSAVSTPCIKPTKPSLPVMNAVCEGDGFSVTGVSLDPLATFQWKISTDGGTTWNNVSANDFTTSGTTNVLTTSVSKQYMNNAQVKVVLTDIQTGTCTEESNPVSITLNTLPNVSLVPPSKTTLCVDDNEERAFVQSVIGKAPLLVDYTLNGVTTTNQDIATLEIKFPTTVETNYSLTIDKVIDANGCSTTLTGISTAVSVHNNPTPKFALSDTIGCYPAKIDFFDISGEVYTDVTWDFGTGSNSSKDQGMTSFTYMKGGDYSITYTVINAFGCEGQLVKKDTIHIKNVPTAKISADRITINVYENEVKFDSKLSQNGSFYKWDFGDNTPTSSAESVKHTYDPTQPGKYKVTLIVSNSVNNETCGDTAVTWIDFPEEVVYFIPNTFTPNGDEFNNTFQPVFTSGFDPQHYLFTIYNRWGQVVFESKNPTIGWDGTYGGKLLTNDTFIWKLGFKEKANDNEHYTTGHVNLVR